MVDEVNILGMKELREALLRKIPLEFHSKAIQLAAARAVKLWVDDAKWLAPSDTGALRTAIHSEKDRTNSTSTFHSRIVRPRTYRGGKKAKGRGAKQPRNRGSGASYWWHVEFGFRRKGGKMQPPQPYLRPAFEAQRLAVTYKMISELKLIMVDAVKAARWKNKYGITARDVKKAIRDFS